MDAHATPLPPITLTFRPNVNLTFVRSVVVHSAAQGVTSCTVYIACEFPFDPLHLNPQFRPLTTTGKKKRYIEDLTYHFKFLNERYTDYDWELQYAPFVRYDPDPDQKQAPLYPMLLAAFVKENAAKLVVGSTPPIDNRKDKTASPPNNDKPAHPSPPRRSGVPLDDKRRKDAAIWKEELLANGANGANDMGTTINGFSVFNSKVPKLGPTPPQHPRPALRPQLAFKPASSKRPLAPLDRTAYKLPTMVGSGRREKKQKEKKNKEKKNKEKSVFVLLSSLGM